MVGTAAKPLADVTVPRAFASTHQVRATIEAANSTSLTPFGGTIPQTHPEVTPCLPRFRGKWTVRHSWSGLVGAIGHE
jgi:hypothetical protein